LNIEGPLAADQFIKNDGAKRLPPIFIFQYSIVNFELDGFFNAPVNICRYPAKVDGFDSGYKAFTSGAVFLGFSATAPQQFHPMGGTAFRTDTFDCKAVTLILPALTDTILIVRQAVAAEYRHIYISPY
jgi:hypothetical protein